MSKDLCNESTKAIQLRNIQSRGVTMITREEAIQATNIIFKFCCQQKDCKSCPFKGKRFFVPEQGYMTCGLYEEPCAWNRVWNKGE